MIPILKYKPFNLPDALAYFQKDGGREEVKRLFLDTVFGNFEDGAEKGFSFEVIEVKDFDFAVRKTVLVKKNSFCAPFTLFLPKNKVRPPVLVFSVLESYNERFLYDEPSSYETKKSVSSLPIRYIVERGFALCCYHTSDVAVDNDGCFSSGLLKELLPARTNSSAGALYAWAFFASRIVDYLVRFEDIDTEKIGVLGHSRGGKTALLAGATDTRFSFVCSNNSGCTGASLARNNKGETIKDIVTRFPYWFCDNYLSCSDKERTLPFDFHMLLGLIAPRLLLVNSSSKDKWACPKNEYLSCFAVSEIYEKVYQTKGFLANNPPKNNMLYDEGNVGYFLKKGKHSFSYLDWQTVIKFLQKKGW